MDIKTLQTAFHSPDCLLFLLKKHEQDFPYVINVNARKKHILKSILSLMFDKLKIYQMELIMAEMLLTVGNDLDEQIKALISYLLIYINDD